MPSARPSAFSRDDPIHILAHDLDYWLPPVTAVMEQILHDFPLVDAERFGEAPVVFDDDRVIPHGIVGAARMGGDLWRGETEADDVVDLVVETADANGQLRALLEVVQTHRVHDDFSPKWSRAREDFERKLNHKRSPISVRFVELPDTIAVHGPDAEVEDNIVFGNFLALLDQHEREVVVLLRSGVTKLGDVASILGYANHSPVSKRLARIRKKASDYFDRS